MTYATAEDLIARFGSDEIIALSQADGGELNLDKIGHALADAESEINSYLVQRYNVPVNPQPPIITSACCDIARYLLASNQATDEMTKRYDGRISWLKTIAKGQAGLGIAEREASASSNAIAAIKTAENRTFTRDSLRDF